MNTVDCPLVLVDLPKRSFQVHGESSVFCGVAIKEAVTFSPYIAAIYYKDPRLDS